MESRWGAGVDAYESKNSGWWSGSGRGGGDGDGRGGSSVPTGLHEPRPPHN